LNLFIVFLVSGLWHGAAWTFVAWGALHGFYLLFALQTRSLRERAARALGLDRVPRAHALLERLVVFHLVTFAWLFFRAEGFGDAWTLLSSMPEIDFSLASLPVQGVNGYELSLGVLFVFAMTAFHAWQRPANSADFLYELRTPVRYGLLYLLVASIVLFGQFNVTEFIYFQF
jgi:D-alanyl-lipoteichoic acid acyltransferase DltB (MBOAT superfamily)